MNVLVEVLTLGPTDGCGGVFVVGNDATEWSWHVEAVPGGYEWENNPKFDSKLWSEIKAELEPIVCIGGGRFGVRKGQKVTLEMRPKAPVRKRPPKAKNGRRKSR